MKNIAFIINPISGSRETQNAKKRLPKLIMQTLDSTQWLPNIAFTEYAGHATELAHQYARMGFDAVVAVGGMFQDWSVDFDKTMRVHKVAGGLPKFTAPNHAFSDFEIDVHIDVASAVALFFIGELFRQRS